MAERGGRRIVHHDGTTTQDSFDLPAGTVEQMMSAFEGLKKSSPPSCFLVNRRVYEMLRRANAH